MRRIKIILIAIAIVVSIGGAFAEKTRCALCETYQQYHKVGDAYVATGEYGYDYACWQVPGTCTYYQPDPVNQPDVYLPCRSGVYGE